MNSEESSNSMEELPRPTGRWQVRDGDCGRMKSPTPNHPLQRICQNLRAAELNVEPREIGGNGIDGNQRRCCSMGRRAIDNSCRGEDIGSLEEPDQNRSKL